MNYSRHAREKVYLKPSKIMFSINCNAKYKMAVIQRGNIYGERMRLIEA